MQSKEEMKVDEIKPGKYEFIVQGVLSKDANGYEFKTKTGNNLGKPYRKLRLIILDGKSNHSIYYFVFGSENIKEIVYGISNPTLTFVYESDPKSFELENLIGEGGMLLLGYNKSNYPKIECFIKPKGVLQESHKQMSKKEPANSYQKDAEHAKDPNDEELPF